MEYQRKPGNLSHVGLHLWRAGQWWLDQYEKGMYAAGYPEYTKSRANLLVHLEPEYGVRQSYLTEKTGLTKQAVNQLLDDMERVGIIQRGPDPTDRRARLVSYTDKGRDMLLAGDKVKTKIEADLRQKLGSGTVDQLHEVLGNIVD